MSEATLNKLQSICKPHGVDIDFIQDSFGYWQVLFHAPEGKLWASTLTYGNCFANNTLRGVIGYIREELKAGFIGENE